MLTKGEENFVVWVFLEVGKSRQILPAKGTEHTVIQGSLQTFGAKCLIRRECVERKNASERTCWQGVVIGW